MDTRSTGEVIASLIVNAQAMVAKEVELARLELRRIVARKVAAVVMLLLGALALTAVVMKNMAKSNKLWTAQGQQLSMLQIEALRRLAKTEQLLAECQSGSTAAISRAMTLRAEAVSIEREGPRCKNNASTHLLIVIS